MRLSNEDVDQIVSAIEIAEGETGGEYDIKFKLFEMFPKVKQARDEREAESDRETIKQTDARKSVTDLVFSSLQKDQAIIPQLKSTMTKQFYEGTLRENYSDEICLPADLFKYHLDELKELGLLKELREWLKLEGEKKGNEWMRDDHETTPDEELWHDLRTILGSARRYD